MNNLLLKFFRFSSFSLLKLRRLPEDLHFCTGVADSFLYQQINVHIWDLYCKSDGNRWCYIFKD